MNQVCVLISQENRIEIDLISQQFVKLEITIY